MIYKFMHIGNLIIIVFHSNTKIVSYNLDFKDQKKALICLSVPLLS
jgi:hypothetical protein